MQGFVIYLRCWYTFTKLKESEEKYREIFNNPADSIIIHDLEGNFLEANDIYSKIIGYSKEELLKMNLKQLDHPKYAALIKERMENTQRFL